MYAAIEGVFIGMISKYFEYLYNGIVAQAVLGTFAAAGVTLAAYKFFNIRVTPKFTKIVVIATISFAVAMLPNFVLALAGVNMGLRDDGTGPVSLLAIGVTLLGAVLAVLEPRARLRLHREGRRDGGRRPRSPGGPRSA